RGMGRRFGELSSESLTNHSGHRIPCAGWRIGGILPERLREIARFLQLDLRLSWFDIKVRIIMLVGCVLGILAAPFLLAFLAFLLAFLAFKVLEFRLMFGPILTTKKRGSVVQ